MKTDQDLIFEAYIKTLINEKYHNDALMVKGSEYIVQAEVSGDDVEITTLFKYDKKLDDHREINLHSISPQLRQDIEDAVLNDVGGKNYEDNEVSTGISEQLDIFIENHPEFSKQLSPIWNEMSEIAEELGKFDIDEDSINDIEVFLDKLNIERNRLESFMREYSEKRSQLSPILDELEDIIDELDGHYKGGHLNQDELYGIADRIASGFAEDNEGREKNIRRGKEYITADQEEYYKQLIQSGVPPRAAADKFEDQYGFRYPEEDAEDFGIDAEGGIEGGAVGVLRGEGGAVNLLEQLIEEAPELEDQINQIIEKVFDAVDILKQEQYVDDPQLQIAYDSLIEGDF